MFENFYKGNYKNYFLLSAVLAVVFLFMVFVNPGLKTGIDLRGGTLLLVQSPSAIDEPRLEQLLKDNFQFADLSVTTTSSAVGYGTTIQFAYEERLENADKLIQSASQKAAASNPSGALADLAAARQIYLPLMAEQPKTDLPVELKAAQTQASAEFALAKENIGVRLQSLIKSTFNLGPDTAFQVREVSPILGKAFVDTSITVAIVAMLGIIVVVFAFFREIIPSLAVIEAGVFDVIAALAGMALFNIPLSLNTIPALLMLVGYSIDTDILLTTRVLKRTDKTPADRAGEAMMTGLTMTLSAMVAVGIMLVFAQMNQITVIYEIAAVILMGSVGDIIATWFTNGPILLWYVESKTGNKSVLTAGSGGASTGAPVILSNTARKKNKRKGNST
jgi:preprotein translocase subunit SecF